MLGLRVLTKQKYNRENLAWMFFVEWRQRETSIWAKLYEIAARFIQPNINFSNSNLPWHPHDSLISNQQRPAFWV